MWSDNESDVDLLGFDYLTSAITSIVGNGSLLPATIGVYGDWGSGKSSLLKRTQVELEKDKNVLVLSFTGWLFEGYEDAKTALMGTILDEITAKRKLGPKARNLVVNLINRINVMQLLGSVTKVGLKSSLAYATGGWAGLGLSGATDAAQVAGTIAEKLKESDLDEVAFDKFIKEDPNHSLRRGIREFRKDFEKLLEETDIKTLVIIIDDLDRCNPDTIIETLEAIKLFLFVPHTAFILGADERLIKYAVRRRFPQLPGERAEIGVEYLEKLIQFDIRIPSLGRSELETYINLLFFEKTNDRDSDAFRKALKRVQSSNASSFLGVRFNYGIAEEILGDISSELAEDLSIAQRISSVLVEQLKGNPRQCKRFLNKLILRIEMAKAKQVVLKQRILAKLMLLEYFSSQFFRELSELQAAEEGRPKDLVLAERIVSPPQVEVDEETDSKNDELENSEVKGKKRASAKQKKSANSSANEELAQPVSTWITDSWMKEWLKSSPSLVGEDLQPYFFFSRDRIQGSLSTALQRMTPQAQDMLNSLFQESQAARNVALKKAKDLSPGDSNAIFQALTDRAREEEDLGGELSAFNRLYDWVENRPELSLQFISFVRGIPIGSLPINVVTRLEKIAKEHDVLEPVKDLFRRWSANEGSSPVKKAAESRLRNL